MAQITVELSLRTKWWLKPAVWIGGLALAAGLIPDAPSAEHWGGRITGAERLAKWLADYAFTVEVR